MIFTRTKNLKGSITVPGDKSISHRAVMFGALAEGLTEVEGFLPGADCLSTIDCFRRMGISIEEQDATRLLIHGKGLHGLKKPADILNTGNSGTTTRLITGLLAGLKTITASVEGDATIAKRPMDRVVIPLSEMGADITLKDSKYPPVNIQPAQLKPLEYKMPIASAQVKSAILFAGLFTSGETIVHETHQSRNHSELMMAQFGADITVNENTVTLKGGKDLSSSDVTVPGDISSAAFLIVLALITKGSDITIENVSLNETRSGIIDVVKMCGGDITITEHDSKGEPFGDIRVRYTEQLKPFHIDGEIIPRLIDEIPILAVLGVFADGDSTVRGAEELRFKETDRITAVVNEL